MVGLVLIAGAGSVLALVLELLLIVAGLDLLVTGALGHCPLYAKPGHVPKSGCAAGNSMSSETSPPPGRHLPDQQQLLGAGHVGRQLEPLGFGEGRRAVWS
ncbi:YgaP family membrane protein [Streptomyces sp. NPDC001966]